MTLRFLLALQIAFLLAGTSSPGRPAGLGVVVEANRAHLGATTVSPGATVYDGDQFSTEEGGALWLRCNAALLEVAEKSAVVVRRAGSETQDGEAETELLEGALVFSTARTGALEIQARGAHIRSAGAGRTVGKVSVNGPKDLRIYALYGAVLFSYRGETKTIAEGESYRVILDPPEDGSEKKQGSPNARRPPKAFLLAGIGAGAAAAAVTAYEKHEHKHMESPDHP